VSFDERTLPEQKRGVSADAPANPWEGRVAAVIADGGRAQMRDERWGTPKPPGERRNWWGEPQLQLCCDRLSDAPLSRPEVDRVV
jgi:hypothetical protein